MKNSFIKGISIVEIVIAAGIISISITGIFGAIQIYLKVVQQNAHKAQAVLLLDETAEALQYLRDEGYHSYIEGNNFNTEYSIFWNGSRYELGTSTITLPYQMNRNVRFEEVKRDSNDQITSGTGTVDPDTRRAVITIVWPYKGETKSLSSEVLIHNIYEN
jgi:Tfp pilus assembly protein PilV